MNLLFSLKSNYLNHIGIWSLFYLSSLRSIALFNLNPYIAYIIMPGVLLYFFLPYHSLKTRKFIPFNLFLLAIAALSLISQTGYLILEVLTGLRLHDLFFHRSLFIIIGGMVVAIFLYIVTLALKKLFRA